MIDPELKRFIMEEVKRQTAVILSGTAGETTPQLEAIDNLYPGMPTLSERPVAHPYGVSSRAPKGTISVTARQGDNPANRIVISHRDPNRPELLEGEFIAYNAAMRQMRLLLDKIQIGGADSAENIVLGQQLKEFLTEIDVQVQAIASAVNDMGTAVSALAAGAVAAGMWDPLTIGKPVLDAGIAAASAGDAAGAAGGAVAAADAAFVANDAILSDETFARKSG